MTRMTKAERQARMGEILDRQAAERVNAARVDALGDELVEARKRRVRRTVDQAASAAGAIAGRVILAKAVKGSVTDRAMAALKPRGKKAGKGGQPGQVVAYRGGVPVSEAVAAVVRRDTIGYLLHKEGIDKFQHAAGVAIRALWVARAGGARSPDPTLIKVDGGGRVAEAIQLGALAAGKELRRLITMARLGAEEAEIVLRVCGESESLTTVAIRLEENPAMLANGGCSRETADRVKLSLKRSLRFIANVMHGRPARGPVHPYQDDRVLAWLGDGARPVDLAKRA